MMNTLSRRRSFNAHGARMIEADITAAIAEVKAERDAKWDAARAAADAIRAEAGTVTRDDIAAALASATKGVAVRDSRGSWHLVTKLNRTTVAVPGAWGDTMNVAITKLTGLKSA